MSSGWTAAGPGQRRHLQRYLHLRAWLDRHPARFGYLFRRRCLPRQHHREPARRADGRPGDDAVILGRPEPGRPAGDLHGHRHAHHPRHWHGGLLCRRLGHRDLRVRHPVPHPGRPPTYTATCTTSALPTGSHAISASYSGDSVYPGQFREPGRRPDGEPGAADGHRVGRRDDLRGTPPAITPSYTGFVNGDGPASLDTAPACATTATSASPAGSTRAVAQRRRPDYAISYVNGVVTVGQASTALAYTARSRSPRGTSFVPAAALSSPASACQPASR